jgi:hypothetical protein
VGLGDNHEPKRIYTDTIDRRRFIGAFEHDGLGRPKDDLSVEDFLNPVSFPFSEREDFLVNQ